jgi:hypothetical protein
MVLLLLGQLKLFAVKNNGAHFIHDSWMQGLPQRLADERQNFLAGSYVQWILP